MSIIVVGEMLAVIPRGLKKWLGCGAYVYCDGEAKTKGISPIYLFSYPWDMDKARVRVLPNREP